MVCIIFFLSFKCFYIYIGTRIYYLDYLKLDYLIYNDFKNVSTSKKGINYCGYCA